MRPLFAAASLAAMLLAACEREPAPENGAIPAPSPTPTPAPVLGPAPPPAAGPATTGAVRPGEFRTFGDWAVGCDNTALCEMASLGPGGDLPSGVTLAVLRQPGDGGAVDLSFDAVGDGAALGDCGVHPTLVWDGTRLRLAARSGMPECRGNPHYLTTWRAQVVRA